MKGCYVMREVYMKNILITGGAGFIGSHTADALLARGYNVRLLDCLDPQVHGEGQKRPAYLDSRLELMVGDVRSRETLERAIEGVNAVYHFAASTGVGQSMYAIHNYSDVNVGGTAMLLDVLANSCHSVTRIILSSSRAVYGEGAYNCKNCGVVSPPPRSREQLERHEWEIACPCCFASLEAIPTPEEKPLQPISVYALTKRIQEDMLGIFSASYGVPHVILRYFNVYGERQAINNPYTGIGAIFANRAISGHDIDIYEDGRPGRDFVHVKDVVQANLLALENDRAENGTFNVGSGECLTVLDLATQIKEKVGSGSGFRFEKRYRLGDIRCCYADLARSRGILGYVPTIPFDRGVSELVAWAKGEELQQERLEEAESALRERGLGR
jgi:dTDP-L-rhamnose 4-epimerase